MIFNVLQFLKKILNDIEKKIWIRACPSLRFGSGCFGLRFRFGNPFRFAQRQCFPFTSLTLIQTSLPFLLYTSLYAQNYTAQTLSTFPGPEDITWNHSQNIAFISCNERRKKSPLKNQNGKILGLINQQIITLHDELPFPFHPHGIDYEETSQQLYVINHRKKKLSTIEVFQYQNAQLIHIKTIENQNFISPNDLHVIQKDTFLVTNDPNGRSFFYLLLNFLFRFRTDKVIAYENGKTKVFCKMNYPNGIIKIDSTILISSIYKRRIEAFNPQGKKTYHISLDSAPDNLEIDEQNHLWTATHVKFKKFIQHMKDSTAHSPSKIYKIIQPTSPNYSLENIPIENISISAASVVAPHQNQILIGCVFDGKIYIRKPQN